MLLLSKYLELEEEFEENGIFDIALDMDSNYFINVKLLEKTTTQETTQENYAILNETQIHIIKLIKENPSIIQKEIAKELEMTRDGVKYNMNVLKELSIISREGSTKKGKWKIIK